MHLHSTLSHAESTMLRRIQSGGVWVATTAAKFDSGTPAVCQRCGESEETWQHLWWECPHYESIRQRIWGDDRPNHLLLPPLVRLLGVAPGLR
eukprot:710692-Alexandrium_andersonii.AAC.1